MTTIPMGDDAGANYTNTVYVPMTTIPMGDDAGANYTNTMYVPIIEIFSNLCNQTMLVGYADRFQKRN